MTRILKRLAAAACMTLTLGVAFADQPLKIGSITYDPQANVNGEQLLLNGAGLRTKIFFKVYTAGLYLKAPARRNTEAMAQNSAARVRLGQIVGETAVAVPLGVGLIVRILARKGVDEPAHELALGLLVLLVAHHARGALSGAKRHVADGLREDLARHLDAQKIGQTLRPGTEVLAASCAAVRSATGHVPSPIVQLSLSALRPVKRSVQSAAVEFTVSESFSGVISSAFVSVRTMS